MDDLVQWLGKQLDDERNAAEDALKKVTTTRRWIGGQWVEDTVQPPEWRRSAWSPARVLREIDAKRQVLALHHRAQPKWCAACDIPAGFPGPPDGCATLRLLALPYADRPGYREEWRP